MAATIETRIVSQFEVRSTAITEQEVTQEIQRIEDLLRVESGAVLAGSTIVQQAVRDGRTWVLVRIPRLNLPAQTQAAVQPWSPARDEAAEYVASDRTTRQVRISTGSRGGIRVDDPFEIHGRDRAYPVVRTFGVGRVSSVRDSEAEIDLFSDHDLPDATDLWLVPQGDSGLAVGLHPIGVLLSAPRLNTFNLDHDPVSFAFGGGASIAWNIGKFVFGWTEFWLSLEPQIAVGDPLTLIGTNLLLRKTFRLGTFGIDLGLGGAFTARILDTTGTSIRQDGDAPASLTQLGFGAAAQIGVSWYATHTFALTASVTYRWFPELTTWEGFDLDYIVDENSLTLSAGLLLRF